MSCTGPRALEPRLTNANVSVNVNVNVDVDASTHQRIDVINVDVDDIDASMRCIDVTLMLTLMHWA